MLAFGGGTAVQKGVLWWAGHHRHHHRYSDTERDIHSPRKGFWWSHVGWIVCDKYNETLYDNIKDFAKYPELRWLNKHDWVPPWTLGVACFLIGGWPGLFVGFFLSTVLLWHGTFTINSLAHVFGRRRYDTADTSRNSFLLALITLGEGWHNNHHHYPASARQGFFWWEIDVTYYMLKMLSWVGIVRDLKQPPARRPAPEVHRARAAAGTRNPSRRSRAGQVAGRVDRSGSRPASARTARIASATIVSVGPVAGRRREHRRVGAHDVLDVVEPLPAVDHARARVVAHAGRAHRRGGRSASGPDGVERGAGQRRRRDPEGVVRAGLAHDLLEAGRPVLRARDLVPVGRVRDPPGGHAPHVTHRRVEVDAVRRLRQVLALHRERAHAVPRHGESTHELGVQLARAAGARPP